MHFAPPDRVPVFGQVGQVAEVGEGADHAHRLGRAESLEQILEGALGALVGIAPEGHRQRADLFHQVVSRIAFLLTNHVAEDPAQQPDVVDQRLIVIRLALDGSGLLLGGILHFDLSPREGLGRALLQCNMLAFRRPI